MRLTTKIRDELIRIGICFLVGLSSHIEQAIDSRLGGKINSFGLIHSDKLEIP